MGVVAPGEKKNNEVPGVTTRMLMSYAVESAPLIQFPLFVAVSEPTKLCINTHV